MRGRGAWLALVTIAIALAIVFGNRSPTHDVQHSSAGALPAQDAAAAPRTSASPPRTEDGAASRASTLGGGKGFRSTQQLDEHYAKHGAEFGRVSEQEYLRQAQRLRDAPAGGSIEELRRSDGTVSRFDRQSGAFIAFNSDGTIRTFFKPNDGESYFRRQASRAH